jgi:hypothetical protein
LHGQVDVAMVEDWTELCEALDRAFTKSARDDWVVIDSISDVLDFGLDHYNQLIRGQDTTEYLANWAKRANDPTKLKATGQQGALIEGGVWDFFGPALRSRIIRRIKNPGRHLYVTAQAQAAGANPKEDAQTKIMYGGIGWKPRGQRDVGFNAATVVYLEKDRAAKGKYSVAKNWGRERTTGPLMDVPYENFATDFLFKKCGWRPERKA